MSWASHPTAEMRAARPPGRHRRRGTRVVVAMAVSALLVATVGVATLAPTLLNWQPSVPGAAPSTVADTGVSPTATLTPPPTPSPSPSPSAVTTSLPPTGARGGGGGGLAALEEAVFASTNAVRAKEGCTTPLRMDESLRTAARMHSADMVEGGYFDHDSPDGRTPGQRMRDAGYNTDRGWAENIARGYPTVEAVMAGWMGSDGHRANILNCKMKALGVGVARAGNGRLYWTQDFGGR